jgi:hypothetical protein
MESPIVMGSKGAGTPHGRWVWESEVSHLVLVRLDAGQRQRLGGCNGGTSDFRTKAPHA